MARRFEKSGELLMCYTHANAPKDEDLEKCHHSRFKVWLALAALVMGLLFMAPHPLI